MRKLALSDEILMTVEKPARYIGGEVNAVIKDKEKTDIRFCMGGSRAASRLAWCRRS